MPQFLSRCWLTVTLSDSRSPVPQLLYNGNRSSSSKPEKRHHDLDVIGENNRKVACSVKQKEEKGHACHKTCQLNSHQC